MSFLLLLLLVIMSSLKDKVKLRLRYWNCRGRVQAVRLILADLLEKSPQLDYEEENESLEKGFQVWLEHKYDEKYAGPFQNLPVLIYNDDVILGQTLTIGQFLARKFDLYGQLTATITDRDVLRGYIDGVVSCAYTDVISNILMCIWNGADFVDPNQPINRMSRKIPADLQALNRLLTKSSTPFFYDQPEPTLADYFVLEALTATRDYYVKLLPNESDRQALDRLEKVMKERTGLKNYFESGRLFKRFTGSPKEDEYIAELATRAASSSS